MPCWRRWMLCGALRSEGELARLAKTPTGQQDYANKPTSAYGESYMGLRLAL